MNVPPFIHGNIKPHDANVVVVVVVVIVVVVVEAAVVGHWPHKTGQYEIIEGNEHCDAVKLLHSTGCLLHMSVSHNIP